MTAAGQAWQVDDLTVGNVFRAVRRRRRLRQLDVARASGVSQQTVSVIERGRLDAVDLDTLRRVGRVLEIAVPFAPRWRGPELDRLLDRDHAALVERCVGAFEAHGWTVIPEWSFNHFGDRGSVDVLAWHPSARAIAVVEVKTRIVDVQDLLAKVDRKVRVVREILPRERGWNALGVGRLLVVPDSRSVRDAIDQHARTFAVAFPARTVAARRWVAHPVGDLAGIWFLASTSVASGERKRARNGRVVGVPRGRPVSGPGGIPSPRVAPRPGTQPHSRDG